MSQNPAEIYRSDFERLCRGIPREGQHSEFRRFWDDEYRNELPEWVQFLYAIGLVIYGEIGAAKFVLDFLPADKPDGTTNNLKYGAGCLRDLLPLPQHLDPLDRQQHAAIKDWIETHRDQLSWNEEKGQYELTSS